MKHDMKKSAKMGSLKDLSDEMRKMMGEGYEGIKKVTVASDSEEGLEEGLDKAKEILKKKLGSEDMMEEESMSESDDEELEVSEEDRDEMEDEAEDLMDDALDKMSPEEIKAKIEKLKVMLEGME